MSNPPPTRLLPDLTEGSPLTVEREDGSKEQFGTIYADGQKAWVTFKAKENSTDTVLSDYGELSGAYFYLNCRRADEVPPGETPIEGTGNLYAMEFENGGQLNFGYKEQEPVTAKAEIKKGGSLKDKTITWTITYTPWQNPSPNDPVTGDTPFELRDTIDTSLHSYVDNSAKIDGQRIDSYPSRAAIPENAQAYVLAEPSEDGKSTILIFGGRMLEAGRATLGNPAKPLTITYETSVRDELLLPGGGSKKVENMAQLFAGPALENKLEISGNAAVTVQQPKWIKKEGSTTRTPGSGSTTSWTVTFYSNGFTFIPDNGLTLHDQLPQGSTLVSNSVKVDGASVSEALVDQQNFTVSPIMAGPNQPVEITYETHVPEDMYDSGTSLGSNTAWFTFDYQGEKYTTPKEITPVGSGDGSGTPGTARLVKTNGSYNSKERTIPWTVKINPHQAYLKGGTFTDDLRAVGPGTPCTFGHPQGLELVNGTAGIDIKIDGRDPTEAEKACMDLKYSQQVLTITVGDIGAKTITLTYTTKVCDPCIFANNRGKTPFTNRISTDDMLIGSQAVSGISTSADSTANVSATVLTKRAPVYDYQSGIMKWTVDVNGAGLPMEEVVLRDELPSGLTFLSGSLATNPAIPGASASVQGQELTIHLGTVTESTAVTFDTRVDPELLGFGGDQPVVINNSVCMNGKADQVSFAEVSHSVQHTFSNHGLVKSSRVDNQQELIQYEVLINPYHLALPENPSLVDTLDERLQLDRDTLRFYEAELRGTTADSKDQRPAYTKNGEGQRLEITGFDPVTNSFTVELPVEADNRDAYVLTYTADVIRREADGYGNSVRFEGGSVLLGGSKDNSAAVGGGGGGGGGAVAARKATISIAKTDSETGEPLTGVSFLLYQWDHDSQMRGLPFAQEKTDSQGKLSFQVKPGAFYELVETDSIPGYGSVFGWTSLPDGVTETDEGLLLQAGAAKSELKLELTNEAHTAELVFRLVNESGIPMAGEKVQMFKTDPFGEQNPSPDREVTVLADGTVRFSGVRRGARYYIKGPDGGIMIVEIPIEPDEEPRAALPDGTWAALTDQYQVTGTLDPDQQWNLTVNKIISGTTTPLSGASIGLYADKDCRALIKTGVSGPDGVIIFAGLIRGQSYWLKENAAPSHYNLDPTVYEADEGESTVIIANKPEDSPVDPDDPHKPGTPDEPGIPDKPGTPDEPDIPDKPGTPDNPEVPDKPGTPDEPGIPGKPGISDEPGASSKPIIPGFPGSDSSEKVTHIPQTGDDTEILIAVVLFLGALLTAVTIYRFLLRKVQPEHGWLANRAGTNLTVSPGSEGAPVYEQKELR